jgi:hypothetical protein
MIYDQIFETVELFSSLCTSFSLPIVKIKMNVFENSYRPDMKFHGKNEKKISQKNRFLFGAELSEH